MIQEIRTPSLSSKELYFVLKNKGVQNLFHANTVKTSLTFIGEGSLLSRQYVETNELIQTEQYTDQKDKCLGIWDAVFLDGTDLHQKYTRFNKYGPILFYIDLNVLLSDDFPEVKISKSNPDSWDTSIDKFYESISEFDRDYLTGNKLYDGRIMFLFDKPQKKLILKRYCKKILIDDPKINLIYPDQTEKQISEMVKEAFNTELKKKNLYDIIIEIRHSDAKLCGCYFQYKNMYSNNKMNFDKLFKK